jgi:hypothetical protein
MKFIQNKPCSSVPDPDPDPMAFGPPGPGSGVISADSDPFMYKQKNYSE